MLSKNPQAAGGLIQPDGDPAKRGLWSEAITLRARHARLSNPLEKPSPRPLPQRIEAAVTTAIVPGSS